MAQEGMDCACCIFHIKDPLEQPIQGRSVNTVLVIMLSVFSKHSCWNLSYVAAVTSASNSHKSKSKSIKISSWHPEEAGEMLLLLK